MLILCILMPGISSAETISQREAFPGAEGFGRMTTGGRGGTVYHVTTLEDNSEPGSFRYAVEKSGTRTIVFDVSGTIFLKSDLNLRNGNVTIAGQTAPGDGICIADYAFAIKASNVIIRFMRFRPGNRNVNGGGDADGADGLGALDQSNIIVDHCSVSWSIDECLSFSGTKNTTVQWCIVSQSLANAGHSKGAHGYGGNWGGSGASYHHNLMAHHASRTPRLGPRPTTQLDERMDMRNNVIYNFGGNGCYGGEGMNVNIVNNYYKPGAATKSNAYQYRIAGLGVRTLTYCFNESATVSNYNKAFGKNVTAASVSVVGGNNTITIDGNRYTIDLATNTFDVNGTKVTIAWNAYGPALHKLGTYYVDGNSNSKYPTFDNWEMGIYAQLNNSDNDNFFTDQAKQDMRLDTPIEYVYTTTHSPADAYARVLAYAGASLSRDALDKIIVQDTKDGTCYFGTNGIIDTQDEVYYGTSNDLATGSDGRWPTLASRPAEKDTDGDGIPDSWETANGLDPNDANDGKALASDGFTNLEHYMNSLVEDIMTAENEGGKLLTSNLEYSDAAVELPEYVPGDPIPVESETVLLAFTNGNSISANPPYTDLYTGNTTSANAGLEWPDANIKMYLVKDDKDYGGGNSCSMMESDYQKPIKLSNGAPNLIILPEGLAVNKIEFYGYCNTAGSTTWISDISSEVNGTLESVYSNVTGEENYIESVEKDDWSNMSMDDMPCITCELSKPVSGKLWFKNGGKQPAFYIKLYMADAQSGIEDIITDTEATAGNGKIYNLMGIEVKGNLAPGIYIRDGKKFLVK